MIFAFYLTVVSQRFSYEAALKNTPQTNVINCLKINSVLMNTGNLCCGFQVHRIVIWKLFNECANFKLKYMHSSCSLFQNVDQAYSFVSAILALSRFSVQTENMDYSQKAK